MSVLCLLFPVLLKMITIPFNSKKENLSSILNDLLYLLILIEFLIFYLLRNIISDDFKSGLGYVVIIQILLIVISNLISALAIIGEPLFKYLKSLRKTKVVKPEAEEVKIQESNKSRKNNADEVEIPPIQKKNVIKTNRKFSKNLK